MSERLEELEAQLASLRGEVEALRGRIAVLEGREAGPPPAARRRAVGHATAPAAGQANGAAALSADASVDAVAPLAGWLLLLLAGAFVLRALTDRGTLPTPLGVALGFAYAGGVLALAARAARPQAATVHALTAAIIGFPLLLEATTRFQLLGPAASGLLLLALGGAMLGVAAWRRLEPVAWLATLGVALAALALAVTTGRLAPAALALVAVATAATWLGYVLDWHGPRWPAAAAADLLCLALAARAVAPAAAEGPALALLVAGALVVASLGSFAARTLYLGRSVVSFEVAQTAGVLVAGLGGAAWVTSRAGEGTAALGVGALALAAACYGVAFAFVQRRQQGSANFHFYATVALAFALAGTSLALPAPARGPALALLALGAALLARAHGRRSLTAHAALFAVSAAAASGLLLHADRALFTSAAVPWAPLPLPALGVLACLTAAAVAAARVAGREGALARAPQLVLDAAVALPAAGVLAGLAVAVVGPAGPEADLGLVGTARTAVLALGAVVAAWLGRREAGREAGWLAWPLLAALGLKVLLEDLPRGRPATLILSFAFTGAALILVPRLRARPAAPRLAGT